MRIPTCAYLSGERDRFDQSDVDKRRTVKVKFVGSHTVLFVGKALLCHYSRYARLHFRLHRRINTIYFGPEDEDAFACFQRWLEHGKLTQREIDQDMAKTEGTGEEGSNDYGREDDDSDDSDESDSDIEDWPGRPETASSFSTRDLKLYAFGDRLGSSAFKNAIVDDMLKRWASGSSWANRVIPDPAVSTAIFNNNNRICPNVHNLLKELVIDMALCAQKRGNKFQDAESQAREAGYTLQNGGMHPDLAYALAQGNGGGDDYDWSDDDRRDWPDRHDFCPYHDHSNIQGRPRPNNSHHSIILLTQMRSTVIDGDDVQPQAPLIHAYQAQAINSQTAQADVRVRHHNRTMDDILRARQPGQAQTQANGQPAGGAAGAQGTAQRKAAPSTPATTAPAPHSMAPPAIHSNAPPAPRPANGPANGPAAHTAPPPAPQPANAPAAGPSTAPGQQPANAPAPGLRPTPPSGGSTASLQGAIHTAAPIPGPANPQHTPQHPFPAQTQAHPPPTTAPPSIHPPGFPQPAGPPHPHAAALYQTRPAYMRLPPLAQPLSGSPLHPYPYPHPHPHPTPVRTKASNPNTAATAAPTAPGVNPRQRNTMTLRSGTSIDTTPRNPDGSADPSNSGSNKRPRRDY